MFTSLGESLDHSGREGCTIVIESIGLKGVVIALAAALVVGACGGTVAFVGTELDPPQPAPDFALQSHRGDTFRLGDLRGKVVVLSFLYTSCTDVCPFIGFKLKQVAEVLGDEAGRVAFAVVSTDPERDDLERVRQYSQRIGMYDRWDYLIGSREQLEPVWQAYYVAAPVIKGTEHGEVSDELLEEYGLFRGLDEEAIGDVKGVLKEFGGGYDVQHSTPIWLIDRQGWIRVKLGMDVAPSELVYDIRLLLR